MNKNDKRSTALLFLLGLTLIFGIVLGLTTTERVDAAANTAYLGDASTTQGLIYVPIVIKWPLSTDVSELVTLPENYGRPIGYRQIQFQDQDLPAGGYADDAGQGSGAVAEELENVFVIFEEYGGTGIDANQITVYRQEFDGTAATCDSVVSLGEFIYSPIDEYVFPASY